MIGAEMKDIMTLKRLTQKQVADILKALDNALPPVQRALVQMGRNSGASEQALSGAMMAALDASDGRWIVYGQCAFRPDKPSGKLMGLVRKLCLSEQGEPVCFMARKTITTPGGTRVDQFLIKKRRGKAARRASA